MSSEANINEGGHNLQAAVVMLAAVLFFSFVPLAIALGMGDENPFLLNTGWRLGVALGCSGVLILLYGRVLSNRETLRLIWERIPSKMIALATCGNLSYGIFALSTRFIDVSISAVLFETWPIGFIMYMAWRYRRSNTYKKNMRSISPMLVIALVGFIFLVISQTGDFGIDVASFSNLVIGTGLALLAAIVGGIGAATTLEWGRELAGKLPDTPLHNGASLTHQAGRCGWGQWTPPYNGASLTLFGAIVGITIGNIFAMVLNASFVPFSGEPVSLNSVMIGIVSGLAFQAPAAILLRKSNLITNNLGVNALGYAIPVVSLIWLAIFSAIEVDRVDYLIVGTASIVTANLLINFEAERLLGFKALVISLWACGTLVYLRDRASWSWTAQADGYFDVLFLSATVFALILSFRTARLASRTQEEDNRAFRLFRELEELERRGVIRPGSGTFEHILTIDEKQGRELEMSYTAARRALNDALPQADGPEREKLLALSTELDALAHSRQQGINFGEICALFIFAGLVVGTALLSRPAAVSGLTGFVVEMFAMLFPAVILFLAFNVLDLQRDRVSRILEHNLEYDGYGVAFWDTVSQAERIEHTNRRTVEQWISVGVGVALIVAYAGLFLHKWELWEQVVAAVTGLAG